MDKSTEFIHSWEVPEIDLNIRHYSGHPSDVIKTIKKDIEDYLQNPNVPYKQRSIYSAVYHALNYYKDISYLPAPEYGTETTFLDNAIKTFNNDLEYLSSKYDLDDPMQPPVITVSARIKSLSSFVDKVKEKVDEYLDEGRDFTYFNESLRDPIGVRFVIDPPKEVQEQGLQAESNYLYHIFHDLMNKHGIVSQATNTKINQTFDMFKFIPVNSRYDSTKQDKIRNRVQIQLDNGLEPFSSKLYDENGNLKIFIPDSIPDFIDSPSYTDYFKDYNRYPKFKGYQALHACVIPSFSKDASTDEDIPSYIIPSNAKDHAIEYQFVTAKQNYQNDKGVASTAERKPFNKNLNYYHRLLVPSFITADNFDLYGRSDESYDISSSKHSSDSKKLKLRNYGYSFEKHYGASFKSFFGVPFRTFRDTLVSSDRNKILSRKAICVFDKVAERYRVEDIHQVPVAFTAEELQNLNSSPENLKSLPETAGLADGSVIVDSDGSVTITTPTSPNIMILFSGNDEIQAETDKADKSVDQKAAEIPRVVKDEHSYPDFNE